MPIFLEIPELCVVALIGVSGSGKSTFAAKHFLPTEILNSDHFRALVSDDETDQTATVPAFKALFAMAAQRLTMGKLCVIDATNVQKFAREKIVKLAEKYDCPAIAIVLQTPLEVCKYRVINREVRALNSFIVNRQNAELEVNVHKLKEEGFQQVYYLQEPEDFESVQITRKLAPTNKKSNTGPFDIIGDVHGCYLELCQLLRAMDYDVDDRNYTAVSKNNRTAIFLGDLCGAGPQNVEVLRLVMNMVDSGAALAVRGDCDEALSDCMRNMIPFSDGGLRHAMSQLLTQNADMRIEAQIFLTQLQNHYVLDNGKLVVAHAGLPERMHNRTSVRTQAHCLIGYDPALGMMQNSKPQDWTKNYKGRVMVVYGHTPANSTVIQNNTICIDTGCVQGGKLTGYRYPERVVAQISARFPYETPEGV